MVGQVEVRYARAGTADDAIVAIARQGGREIVLVTDDTELAERVRSHLGHDLDVRSRSACFDAAGKGTNRKGRRPAPARDVGMPSGANSITRELKDLWLTDEQE